MPHKDPEAKRAYARAYYAANPLPQRENVRRYEEKRKAEAAKIILAAKSVPCLDCKQTFPPVCMDFDHVRGSKEFNIADHRSLKKVSIKKLLVEIGKCEVVCANCHRIRTFDRRVAANLVGQL